MDLSKNAQKIFDLVKDLTAVELASLVKALEEEFGVTAASMVVSGGGSASDDSGSDEKDTYNVELTDAGQQKIAVIKEVKTILWIGLKEAKDMIGVTPVIIKENVKTEEAEAMKAQLESAGATVTLK